MIFGLLVEPRCSVAPWSPRLPQHTQLLTQLLQRSPLTLMPNVGAGAAATVDKAGNFRA